MKYIWRSGRKLKLYDTYSSWKDAYNVARYYKRKLKNNYFILPFEQGFLTPTVRYALFMNGVYSFK